MNKYSLKITALAISLSLTSLVSWAQKVKEPQDTPSEWSKPYNYTLIAMKGLSFDIWVASHASQFNLHNKHKPGDGCNPASFMDRKGYDSQINDLQDRLSKRLREK